MIFSSADQDVVSYAVVLISIGSAFGTQKDFRHFCITLTLAHPARSKTSWAVSSEDGSKSSVNRGFKEVFARTKFMN